MWDRWVAWVDREVDARPLRLVRVLAPLALLGDLLDMAWRGATDAALFPAAFGGLEGHPSDWYAFPGVWWGGPLLYGVLLVSLPLVSAGIATRPALVAALVADAQLGHLFGGGDRGIDRILRTALLVLLFSGITGPGRPERVRGWAEDLVRWLLVLVYLQAGVVKTAVLGQWLDLRHPELYTILADPLAGRLDPVAWQHFDVPFLVGGAATLAVELTAPLILTRWAPYWALVAAWIHVGIALTMDLGMFPFGMLSLYPLLFARWLPRRA